MDRRIPLSLLIAAAAALGCGDSNSPVVVVTDAQLEADVAEATGDAIAADFNDLRQNEAYAGLQSPPTFDPAIAGVTVTRSRTCFAANVSQGTTCDPTTTDSVVITVNANGSFSRQRTTASGTETMTTALHRARTLTIRGLAGLEQFRNHNGGGASADTITFSGSANGVIPARVMTVATLDSVDNIVFHLPHATNPWPVGGSLIRYVSGKVTVTSGPHQGERSFGTRVEVTFPADAQGNVSVDVDGTTCNLNLTTRVLSSCN